MKKIYLIIVTLLFISNCTLNKVINHHGVHFLKDKQEKLFINTTNKNDLIQILGPPSTVGGFDEDQLIYIERKISSAKLSKLGKKELIVNNVLILEIDNMGILVSKLFLNKEDINNVQFLE